MDSERGMAAMVTTILISAILGVMATTVFALSNDNDATSSNRTASSQALYAAEGGLDGAYQAITSATTPTLPCGQSAITSTLSTNPGPASYSETVWYYATYPPTSTPLACSAVHQGGASSTPLSAEIYSVGTVGRQQAGMQALVTVSTAQTGGTTGALLPDGIFTGQLQMNSGATLGSTTNSANVYVAGSSPLYCDSGAVIDGSLTLAQGQFTNNGCTITGSVDAYGSAVLDGGAIGGEMTSARSSIMVQGGKANSCAAYSTITVNSGSCGSSPQQKDTNLPVPTPQTFPTFTYTASQWTSAGWTVESSDCSSSSSDTSSLQHLLANVKAQTLIYVNCSNDVVSGTFSLPANVAIVTTGSINFNSPTTIKSSSSTVHDLYLMVPSSSSGTFIFNSQTSFPSLDVLLYTPGSVTTNSFSTVPAMQVYAEGELMMNGTINYVQLPAPPGIGGSVPPPAQPATLGVVYERQYPG